jgi:hypothetical protein
MKARGAPQRTVLLYEDEATFYRQPSQGWLWAHEGRRQPPMRYAHRANTRMRVLAFLDAATGAVHAQDVNAGLEFPNFAGENSPPSASVRPPLPGAPG